MAKGICRPAALHEDAGGAGPYVDPSHQHPHASLHAQVQPHHAGLTPGGQLY